MAELFKLGSSIRLLMISGNPFFPQKMNIKK
jgi:hypothetical protein